MGHFLGGSAPAMVRQIADGYVTPNAVMLKKFNRTELHSLQVELEKKLREARGEIVDLSDIESIQRKNRRLSRLVGALRVIRAAATGRHGSSV